MRGMNEFEFPKRGRGPRDQHGHEHGGHGGPGGPCGPGGPGGPGGRRGGRGPWFGEGGPGPGFGPGFGPGRRGGRGRARRGDVRSAILSLLADGPANGYGLMKGIEERSGGIWRPSPGSVYPTLQQLTDEGLLEEVTTDGRAEHRLTDAGRNHVEEHREALDAAWAQLDESADEHVAFLQSMRKLVGVLKQLARDGSPEQRAAATAKVDALRKELYLLLAED